MPHLYECMILNYFTKILFISTTKNNTEVNNDALV